MSSPRPHTAEWKRIIAMASLGGVTFKRGVHFDSVRRHDRVHYEAWLPDGSCEIRYSKYEAARAAVSKLMGGEGIPLI